VIVHIASTDERIEMRLGVDEASRLLHLQPLVGGRTSYSLTSVLGLGWTIVASTPEERALLETHGVSVQG
jgi:hypothetical protein